MKYLNFKIFYEHKLPNIRQDGTTQYFTIVHYVRDFIDKIVQFLA